MFSLCSYKSTIKSLLRDWDVAIFLGMNVFQLRKGDVECDENGLRVGGDDLLEKYQSGNRNRWRVAELSVVECALSRAYGCEIDAKGKLGALNIVARALDEGDIPLAQIAALLLKLPGSPSRNPVDRRTLGKTLQENGWLLKYWEPDEHPRAGVAPNPGWFAPKDEGGESSSKPRIRVAQTGSETSLPPEKEDPAKVRKRIADVAKGYVNSTQWADGTFYNPLYHRDTNKCFVFVRDVLVEADGDPGKPNSRYLIPQPPYAGQWGDPSYAIPGWKVLDVDETPESGDVVAQKLGYSDASGHVMIVGDDNTFIGTGDPPGKDPGTIEQIPFRDFLGPPKYRDDPSFFRGPLVFRRWIGP
jgi:hypothetical protein